MSLPCAERRDARRHRRRRAAARAAGRVRARPRAVGAAAEIVDGVEAEAERRRIGAADDHRARLFQFATTGLSAGAIDVAERGDAVDGRAAFLVDVFLDRHRHAMQRAERLVCLIARATAASARSACASASSDRSHRDGVELRIDRVHPRNARRDGFARGDLAASRIACGQRRRVPLSRVRRSRSNSLFRVVLR